MKHMRRNAGFVLSGYNLFLIERLARAYTLDLLGTRKYSTTDIEQLSTTNLNNIKRQCLLQRLSVTSQFSFAYENPPSTCKHFRCKRKNMNVHSPVSRIQEVHPIVWHLKGTNSIGVLWKVVKRFSSKCRFHVPFLEYSIVMNYCH